MKGNISRMSYREDQHYSGVFQVQGGMVTDANICEEAIIARARADNLGRDTAASGVPAAGGTVDLGQGGPRLMPGTVYAEGVRGVTRATGPLNGPLALYGAQEDFPAAPPLPGNGPFFLYADLWERTVTRLEDGLLADAGFHGAETAFRQRTMAQIKFAPMAQLGQLGDADGPLPRQGDGRLTAEPVDPGLIADDCDPCADTVAAEQTVANALFRIEVLHVTGDPQSPDTITLAWSAENAAAVARVGISAEDFGRAGAVYEVFTLESEMHLGVHHAVDQVQRSTFIAAVGDAPNPADDAPGPFLRRWDGKAEIDFAAGTADTMGSGGIALDGDSVALTTGVLTARIDFEDRAIVAGDYWLIETRRFAAEPIRVVSEAPMGIRHHYCPLLRVTDGDVEPVSDAERRRLSFPALPDLPASHVSFENTCADLYHGAENVQDALAALCDLNASDVGFDPTGCPRLYDNVDNLQDALTNLCKVDFGIERYLRLMQDWGVVCGVIPRKGGSDTRIAWSAGTILDRAGHLGEVAADELEIGRIVESEGFHYASLDEFASAFRRGEVCLALSIEDGGKIRPHLAPETRAFGPKDPTFLSVFTECRDRKRPFDFKGDLVAAPEANKAVLDKVIYGAASPKLAGGQKLSSSEQRVARKYTDDLVGRYTRHVGDDEVARGLTARIAEIDESVRPDDASGTVREALFLKREALVYKAIRETDEERIRRCLCDAVLPRCPTPGDPPHLVPIACLRGLVEGGQVRLQEVCPHCCRKQAMSWRMVQYYTAELRDGLAATVKTYCCPPPEKPQGGIRPDLKIPDTFVARALKPDFGPNMLLDGAAQSLAILTGFTPPSDYKVSPDIGDLGIDAAKTALEGNGIEVAKTINAADAEAITKLREARVGVAPEDLVLDDGGVSPGDRVALIVQDGVAVDYIKLDTGGGKYLFERAAPAGEITAPDFDARAEAAMEAFDGRLADRTAEAKAAEAELAEAIARRREEISATENDLVRIRAERDAVVREISAARDTLATISEQQKAALAAAAKERDAVVTSMRRETPVAAVLGGEAEFGAALTGGGIVTLGALADLPDAELQRVARDAGLNLTVARRLKRAAETTIKAPIG
ncbi:DUF6519 domain-containing protein [Rhodobacteraceae bacterium DSL-40]|uniref:DUF6519 domain-containing protein n=1 Tax=Amaricoccus sp. B4 TaxID=3368557 RepID=UPI000DAE631F